MPLNKVVLLYLALCFAAALQAQNNKAIADSLLQLLPQSINDTFRIQILNELSFTTSHNEPAASYNYAKEALELSRKLSYQRGESTALGLIGTFYERLGDYAMALDYKLQALKISEQINIRSAQARSYNSIGILYFRQKQYEKALNYYEQALQLALEQQQEEAAAVYLLNIGEAYQEIGQYDKAVEYQEKSMKISRLDPNMQDCVAFSLGIIGKCRLAEQRYNDALRNIEESLKIFRSIEDRASVAEYLIQLGMIYKQLKNYPQALAHLTEAIALSCELQNKIFEKDAEAVLAEVYALQGNYKEAFEAQKRYLALHEAIFNENSTRQMSQMQTIYDTQKKQAQIEILQKDKQLKEEEARVAHTITYFFLALVLMATALLGVVYRSNRQQQKANQLLTDKNAEIANKNIELEQQKEEILAQSTLMEEQNKVLHVQNEEIQSQRNAITASISYALRIQTALLPAEEQLKNYFKDGFIFYQPRDIVSGDFYYFTTVQDEINNAEKIVVAAIDCTGHGVPGALMSMIGHTILNQLIDVQCITSPTQILEELHRKVRMMLRQDSSDNRDGMDIALCVIDQKAQMLHFAGAKNDLYVLQNKELQIIRGDRYSIGGHQPEQQRYFTAHTLPLTNDMRFYLATDGFKDQFGSTTNKKFSPQRFRNLLIELQQSPMSQQRRQLAHTFNNWKGNQSQTDDVLVIGWQYA
ncbi:tetratricopeptide repeat protein [Rhodoflexus sp.]